MTQPLDIPAFAEMTPTEFSELAASARTVPVPKKSRTSTGVLEMEREVRELSSQADDILMKIRTLHVEARMLASQRTALMVKRRKIQRQILNIKTRSKDGP